MAKKLYLIKEGKKVCGLCNGLGEYFDIDPTIIRILWLALALLAGTGVIAYFIAAFVVPKAPEGYVSRSGNTDVTAH